MLISLLSLTACATTTNSSAPKPINEFCALYKPIHWSRLDTDETLKQIKETNAVWVKLCKPA